MESQTGGYAMRAILTIMVVAIIAGTAIGIGIAAMSLEIAYPRHVVTCSDPRSDIAAAVAKVRKDC